MIHGRTCNLCEAMCGILVDVEEGPAGGVVKSIKGDLDDPLSRGHICPKATALADLYTDKDRLQRPLLKPRAPQLIAFQCRRRCTDSTPITS